MEVLKKCATYIQNLDRKQTKNFVLITLAAIIICICILTYVIQGQKDDLIAKIKQLNVLAEKAAKIIADNKKMTLEEFRLKDILDKNKDFTIQSFFEQFCRDLGIIPETGWSTRSDAVNEKFNEVMLPATFKGQTTEQLVKLLDALEKKDMVYLKELGIRREKDSQGKISFDVTLATKRYQSLLE